LPFLAGNCIFSKALLTQLSRGSCDTFGAVLHYSVEAQNVERQNLETQIADMKM
jgi:hypothetical protein